MDQLDWIRKRLEYQWKRPDRVPRHVEGVTDQLRSALRQARDSRTSSLALIYGFDNSIKQAIIGIFPHLIQRALLKLL